MSAVLKLIDRKKERTVSVSTETYVSVDVDVPLSEISTEDLIDELATRDGCAPVGLMQIYEAMAAGNTSRALELMRTHIQDVTGRLLP
jgi:hypothetical protein